MFALEEYTWDEIEGLFWVWDWARPANYVPRLEDIEDLTCFCPRCGCQIIPRTGHESIRIPVRDPRRFLGLRFGGKYHTYVDVFCLLRCPHGCTNIRREGTVDEVLAGFKIKILAYAQTEYCDHDFFNVELQLGEFD